MKLKPLATAVVLVAIGVVMGVIAISHFGNPGNAYVSAGGTDGRLGADNPPVHLAGDVQLLNNAFIEVSKVVTPQVVSISVLNDSDSPLFGGPREAGGSGVIIRSDGYIVTNNHVVESARDGSIQVTMHDRQEYIATLIGRDELTDLAVLRIDRKDLEPAYFGNSDDVQVGQWVVAVGNPLGLRSTITAGIISAIGRGHLGLSRDNYAVENFLQTDAAINPGNSGGGLFDLEGRLVGINTAIASRTGYYQGYGFAIPSRLVESVVDDLIDDGRINRGYIGVSITTVDADDAKAFGLNTVAGVKVSDVLPNSGAKDAGVEVGDVILEVDGQSVRTSQDLQSIVARHRAGERLKLTIWRNEQRIHKEVALKSRTDDGNFFADSPSPGANGLERPRSGPVKFDKLGFTVEPLSAEMRESMNVENGVIVSDVDPYGLVARKGKIRKGVIIVKADREKIQSPGDLEKVISSKEPGGAVLLQMIDGDRTRLEGLEIPEDKG